MENTIRDLWHWDIDGPAQRLRPFAEWVRGIVDAIQAFFAGLSDVQIVQLILLINAVIVAVYLLSHLTRRRWKKGLLLSVFMLAMPVVGPLYLLLGELFQSVQKLFGDRWISTEELSFDQTRVRMILDADVEKDRDVVPVEEALLVSGQSSRREAFLETIKEKNDGAMGIIRGAVESQDAEIAHYAAAYVTDTLTRVKDRESTLRKAFEDKPTPENCIRYTSHLREALHMGVLEGTEKRQFVERLEQSFLWQLENDPSACDMMGITLLAREWMKLGEPDRAKPWIERVQPQCYEDLQAFKVCAVYHYGRHDRAALMALLEQVHGSSLELDSEALEWVRFFERPAEARD